MIDELNIDLDALNMHIGMIANFWMTLINMIVSSFCYGFIIGLMNLMVEEDWDKTYFLILCIPIFLFGCMMTLLVMFMETCCCCCITITCCNIKDDVKIYDPAEVTQIEFV